MKRRLPYLLAGCIAVCVSLTGCHKVCTCIDYGQRVQEFTAEEVDQHAHGNCSEMTDFPVTNRYSYCHW